MARPVFKALAGFCLLALLLVIVVVVATMMQPAPPLPALPKPNGFDEFVAAGKMISGDGSDFPRMTTNELAAFVRTNAAALELARVGLTHECRVPFDYSPTNSGYIEELSFLKRLGVALAAEGKFAESQNRMGDAASAYLATIRLGQESARGGLIINSLVGAAIEAIGDMQMEGAVGNLDARQCRDLATALESAEARRPSSTEIFNTEREWSRRTWGLKGQIARLLTYKSIRQTEQKWRSRAATQEKRTQALVVRLAARAYELEKGTPPPTTAALVPEYLKTVPRTFLTTTNTTARP